MSITDRAQKVLAEIDAALAIADKATKGPWEDDTAGCFIGGMNEPISSANYAGRNNTAFIASSRTGWPASLRCLKTAIEGLLRQLEFSATLYPYSEDSARNQLTTLCDQWEAGR